MTQESELKRINRVCDLPIEYSVPNNCEYCGFFIGLNSLSQIKWISDGMPHNTHGFCSAKCARLWLDEKKRKEIRVKHETLL